MRDFEQSLKDLTLTPYIVKAMALIGVKRRAGSNMFRHQLSTMAILLDYKIIDPVLLKAAVIGGNASLHPAPCRTGKRGHVSGTVGPGREPWATAATVE